MFFLGTNQLSNAEQITDIKFLDTSSDPWRFLKLVLKRRLKQLQQMARNYKKKQPGRTPRLK